MSAFDNTRINTPTVSGRVARAVCLVALAAVLGGCGSPEPTPPPPSPSPPPAPSVPSDDDGVTTAAEVFGPRCTDGTPPVSDRPVAEAVAANPQLSQFAGALGKAGLTGRLNDMMAVTVLAPTDEAFAAYRAEIGEDRYRALMADQGQLADVLSYHVIARRYDRDGMLAAPRGLATLYGGTVRVEPAADTITVTDGADSVATVVCGNLPTGNATVFLVDKVLSAAAPGQIVRSVR